MNFKTVATPLLIGGDGKDELDGGKGGDLLVGGMASQEGYAAALDVALAEWLDDDVAEAITALGSLSDDGDKDTLKGGKGDDKLVGGIGDKLKP